VPSELRFATELFPVINHDRMAGDSTLSSFHPSLQYGFVRSRQLEGTFPGDMQTGGGRSPDIVLPMAGGTRRKKVGPILCLMLFGLRSNPQALTLLQRNFATFRTSVSAPLTTANAFCFRASQA